MKKTVLLSSIVSMMFSQDIMPTIVISDFENSSTLIGSQKLDSQNIDDAIDGNGDIGSVLKTNPNLKVEDKSKGLDSISDITPSKIEINGAKYYQNLLMIDGVSSDSLLDPVNNSKFSVQDVPGNESSMFIDLDLIEEINVYDSAVPAKYGNFNGGVIDVKTKRADFQTHAKIKYKTTSASSSTFNFGTVDSESDALKLESFKEPNFEKKFFSFYFTSPLSEKSTLLASYNYKTSTTPQNTFFELKDTKQINHNLLLKYSYFFDDDSIVDITAIYSPYEEQLFRENVKNSNFTNKGGGIDLKLNYEKQYKFWDLNSVVSLSQSENTRVDGAKDYKVWRKSNAKNWGIPTKNDKTYSIEGNYGNIAKTQETANINLDLESKIFSFFQTDNKVSTGFQSSYSNSSYIRDEESYEYTNSDVKSGELECNGYTQDCIEDDQYFKDRKVYQKENTKVDIANIGIYLDNKVVYKNFEITPGVRADYNTYLQNIDITYRLNASFDFFSDGNSKLFGGVNRYYGKSFLSFKLREARTPYKTEYRSSYHNELNSQDIPAGADNPTVWGTSANKGDVKYIYSGLKTPYTDEQVIGFKQRVFSSVLLIKYVHRDSKNQFKEVQGEYEAFTRNDGQVGFYKPIITNNHGHSLYSAYSFSLSNIRPIRYKGLRFSYNLSTNINTQNSTNFNTYDYKDDTLSREIVILNGSAIGFHELPKREEPTKVNLQLVMDNLKFDIFGVSPFLKLSSFLTYTDTYEANILLDQPASYEEKLPDGGSQRSLVAAYETHKYEPSWNLDLKADLGVIIADKHRLYASLEVQNVFNEVNEENIQRNLYDIGRQVWLEVAYKF